MSNGKMSKKEIIEKLFEEHADEFLKFEKVENKLSSRADLHAFILLDRLQPQCTRDIIACAEHDQIWLDFDLEKSDLSEENIIELRRCGVFYDETDSLSMFV